MRRLINYTCKDCGWKAEIIEQWADLKPKRCMNKKCKASFIKNPEKLDIILPPSMEIAEQEEAENGRRSKRK